MSRQSSSVAQVDAAVEDDATTTTTRSSNHRQPSAHALCEAAVDYVLHNVNTVQYLIHSIEEITQQPFTRERIKCLPASATATGKVPVAVSASTSSGTTAAAAIKQNSAAGAFNVQSVAAGYMWRRARPDCEKGDIVLVEDHLERFRGNDAAATPATATTTQEVNPDEQLSRLNAHELEVHYGGALRQTERNLRHELIHAFDDARGVIESADCTHQACSEIRAARLSGDCFAGEEVKKGRMSLLQGGLRCVRRRATMAVERNPVCRGFSERAVEMVFQRCYSDYEPYAAPIYALGSYGSETFANSTLKL